ncbi:MAG: hypothetical protein QM680_09330 [Luteolibacter sp.]
MICWLLPRKGWQRFEREAPNELWQMDFKEWIKTSDGSRCHPLTLLDDHSRFNLLLEATRRAGFGGSTERGGIHYGLLTNRAVRLTNLSEQM